MTALVVFVIVPAIPSLVSQATRTRRNSTGTVSRCPYGCAHPSSGSRETEVVGKVNLVVSGDVKVRVVKVCDVKAGADEAHAAPPSAAAATSIRVELSRSTCLVATLPRADQVVDGEVDEVEDLVDAQPRLCGDAAELGDRA